MSLFASLSICSSVGLRPPIFEFGTGAVLARFGLGVGSDVRFKLIAVPNGSGTLHGSIRFWRLGRVPEWLSL